MRLDPDAELAGRFGVVYSTRSSNIPNNDFDDVTTTLTAQFGF